MDIRSIISDTISYIIIKEPLLGLMLKKTWIYERNDIHIAATDGLRIYINSEMFNKLDPQSRAYVLVHEVMHIILQHPTRAKKLMKRYRGKGADIIMNIVADAVVNERINMISNLDVVRCQDIIPMISHHSHYYDERICVTESFENLVQQIIQQIMQNKNTYTVDMVIEKFEEDIIGRDIVVEGTYITGSKILKEDSRNNDTIERRGVEERVLNEGDPEDNNVVDGREIEERILRKVIETYIAVKSVGSVPGYLERVVDEIMKPSIDWRILLKKNLIGTNVKRTWSRPSRKHPLFPGKELIRRGRSVVLVDTSGSISENELRWFVSEVYGMLRERNEVIVIPWDATVYEPIKVDRPSDINKVRAKMKGRGGTKILPALEYMDKNYWNVDNVVILSDWNIFDIDDDRVIDLLKKYRSKIIAVTTAFDPPKFLRSIKITRW
ncbi:MAG: VWA-like domain-containing protein [Ignisphaera sp.]